MIYYDYLDTQLGILEIVFDEEYILGVGFVNQKQKASPSTLSKQAVKELGEYFEGKRKTFSLPLYMQGTEFQKQVWKALQDIPYGQTCSYKDIAVKIGKPNASRAVGQANNKNPLSILVPCHRVIGALGNLVGYGGGLNRKEWLLEMEKGILEKDKK
jgi:methylated-DNA-[protein]-cysteine S-methyltransferase